MAGARELPASAAGPAGAAAGRSTWLVSWPLLVAVFVYLYSLYQGDVKLLMLVDGDTYLHVAAGQWIWQQGAVPTHDPFSHSMRGAAWTAHEWLSQLLFARAHALGGWNGVTAVTALAFASTIALLMRALLRQLEPARALLFSMIAVMMTANHLLARPHMLAMPLLMIWMIGLVQARDADRAPSWWLLPVITLWANMHGGFTLGIGLACAFALEALLAARPRQRMAAVARSWGLFLLLAVGAALVTPHGTQAFWFTWQVLAEDKYALGRISEWASPNFHRLQPLELWLLGGLALVLRQGLRLPPVRLILVLGLLHLALKHVRNVELVGLLVPLIVASPFAAQWRQLRRADQQANGIDRFAYRLARPAGRGAVGLCVVLFLALPLVTSHTRPVQPPEFAAPVRALQAVRDAGIEGPVLNGYDWGGYLAFVGIAPFIDGRSDMYRDQFIKQHHDALDLRAAGALEEVLDKYRITWTLLTPNTPAVALLDRLPGWRRIHADRISVVHARDR